MVILEGRVLALFVPSSCRGIIGVDVDRIPDLGSVHLAKTMGKELKRKISSPRRRETT